MTLVKFITGARAKYDALASKETGAIYFLTDTGEIIKDGVNYGTSSDTAALINEKFKDASYDSSTGNLVFTKGDGTTVEVAIPKEVKINANDTILSYDSDGLKATVSVVKLATASDGYASSYQLQDKDGNALGVTIDIPKDMVVSAGEVKTVATADDPYTGAAVGDKYIDLTIANAASSHIYIPVDSLVDVYKAGNGVAIADDNTISVKIDATSDSYLTVGADGVKLSGVAEKLTSLEAGVTANTERLTWEELA